MGSLNEYASLVFPSPLLVVPQVTDFKFRTQGLPVHWAPQSTRALPLGVPQASPADQAQCFNPAGLGRSSSSGPAQSGRVLRY